MRKQLAMTGAVVLLSLMGTAAQAEQHNTEVTTGLYLSKSFGAKSVQTSGINYGLRFNYQNPTQILRQGGNLFNQSAFIDLRFTNTQFDSVYMNGLDVIDTHRALKATGAGAGATWWAVGTAIVATAGLAAASKGSDTPTASNGEEPGGEEPGGEEPGGEEPMLGCEPILNNCL